MKRILCLFICIIVAANLVSCSSRAGNTAIQNVVYPKSIKFEDYEGKSAVRENNPVDSEFINSLDSFAMASASKILKGQTKNINYSPISLYMALSLAGTGAEGATKNEIFSALGVDGKGTDYLSLQNGNLFRNLYTDNKIGKLRIANSLWLKKGDSFKNEFVANGAKNFYASSYNVDFTDDKTAKLMGKWISDNTNGILSPNIKLGKEQIMSIINTIYFKDEWADRFAEKNTKPDTFYLRDGSEIKCDFMNSTYTSHGFTKGQGFTSSALGLKNSGEMIFILPDKGVRVDELLSTPERTASLFDTEGQKNGKVIFKVPKFTFGSDLNLADTLKSMGIVSAFKEDADFKGITDGTAFISNIKQQTHIGIDEKGVEAAAYTDIQYSGSAPPKDEVAEMILNRPFIYAITSNTGAVLFMGVVNNPSEK